MESSLPNHSDDSVLVTVYRIFPVSNFVSLLNTCGQYVLSLTKIDMLVNSKKSHQTDHSIVAARKYNWLHSIIYNKLNRCQTNFYNTYRLLLNENLRKIKMYRQNIKIWWCQIKTLHIEPTFNKINFKLGNFHKDENVIIDLPVLLALGESRCRPCIP